MSKAENIQALADYRYRVVPNFDTAISYVESINKETNRKQDKYFFLVDKFGVVDANTGSYVHDLIDLDAHFVPYLGLAENSIIYQTDVWSVKPESQMALWFSPAFKKVKGYGDNKLVISHIGNSPTGQRVAHNIMVIFECSKEECLRIAKQLAPEQTKEIITPEELRSKLLDVSSSLKVEDILNILEPYIPKNENYKEPSYEDKKIIAQLIVNQADPRFVAEEMARRGIVGEHNLTCVSSSGETYSSLLESSSITLGNAEGGTRYVKNCGNCGAVIEGFISAGYTCKNCKGVYLGC